MGTELVIANPLRIASEDLEGANALAGLGNRNAAYLCEQAAEKVIRAILTAEGKHAGIRHQLDAMVDLVANSNPLKPAPREIDELTVYATAYRYPSAGGRIPDAPHGDELAVFIRKVDAVLHEAARRLGVDLGRETARPGTPGPVRS
ncbi:MAG: HEPN domain-containing protein [Polyangiaceae bacterium]|nr:HEPN domain-containing protein [Polyangiaceae bacterium]